jgi:4-amino-4-deoxy-L-arabinose transferase-like glycosyltransferase
VSGLALRERLADREPAPRLDRRVGFAGAAIVLAYVATRWLFIDRFPYFLDEGTYAVFANRAAHSTSDLFYSFTIGREPLMFWLGIPWIKLGVNPLVSVRLVSAIAGLLTLVFVGLLARRVGGMAAGLTAAALCVVLPFFLVHDGIGIIEPMVTLVMAAALYLQVEFARRPDLRIAALLGLVLAAGVLTKENTKPALALVPLSLLCFDWNAVDRSQRLKRWLAGIGLAAVMVVGAMLLLRVSSLYHLYEESRDDPLLYTVRPVGDVLRDPFGELGATWAAYRPAFGGYVTIPLIGAALAGAVLGLRRQPRLTLLLLAWILLPLAVSMLFSTLPYPRHVMYVMPAAIVLMAYALVEAVRWIRTVMAPRPAALVATVGVAALLTPALLLDARVLAHPDTARYPGTDDVQYVTGTGGGSVWPAVADAIRTRAEGPRVPILTTRSYSQVLEMMLGPDPRYVFVPGRSPLAKQAQFSLDDAEIPFYDPDAAAVVNEGDFAAIGRYERPRGGAVLVLSQRR